MTTPTLTPQDVAEGRRLLARATRGPWEAEDIGAGTTAYGVMGPDESVVMHDFISGANAELVAWMRNHLSDLLVAAERLPRLEAQVAYFGRAMGGMLSSEPCPLCTWDVGRLVRPCGIHEYIAMLDATAQLNADVAVALRAQLAACQEGNVELGRLLGNATEKLAASAQEKEQLRLVESIVRRHGIDMETRLAAAEAEVDRLTGERDEARQVALILLKGRESVSLSEMFHVNTVVTNWRAALTAAPTPSEGEKK